MPQEVSDKNYAEITASCSKVLSYFHLQNNISPIKRLYVKTRPIRNVKHHNPHSFRAKILAPLRNKRRKTSPQNNGEVRHQRSAFAALYGRPRQTIEGEIIMEVVDEDAVVAEQRFKVQLLAFNECNFREDPASLAAFVRRTAEINKLLNMAGRKVQSWNLNSCTGYSGTRNNVRNFFAACYSVLADQKFTPADMKTDQEFVFIPDHQETLISKIASPLELALILAALVESNGQNGIVALINNKWYTGCFLTNECLPNLINDDPDILRKKSERGVSDLSMVAISDLLQGVSFEKAEKSAQSALKKDADVEFIVDIKRARIMHVYPLPERVKSAGGYDLRQSKDYYTDLAPKQLKEYGGEIVGEKEISRVTQWERRLLDMDMRNSLLNFKVSQTAVKLLVPSLEDFIENMAEVKSFTLECKPKESPETLDKVSNGFERATYLKPFADYILYEYKTNACARHTTCANTKPQFCVFSARKIHTGRNGHAYALSCRRVPQMEGTGAVRRQVCAAFPLPCQHLQKGVAAPVYTVEVNTDDLRVNSTLLEFLYQEFDLDMRGLASVELNTPQAVLSVLARIKRETVRFKGWDIFPNVFLASLSFANYLLWHDVKYKSDRFREHPIVRSLINNRLELSGDAFDLSDRSSDEAYVGAEKCIFPFPPTRRSTPQSTTACPRVSFCTDLPERASRRQSPT